MYRLFLALMLVSSQLLAYDVPANSDRERIGLEYSYSEGRGTQTQEFQGFVLSSVSVFESRSAAGVIFQGNISGGLSIGGRAGFYQSIRSSPEGAYISSLDEKTSGPYYSVQIWYNFKKGE